MTPTYAQLLSVHVTCVALSGAGFALRGLRTVIHHVF
jgi:hypothetical protein